MRLAIRQRRRPWRENVCPSARPALTSGPGGDSYWVGGSLAHDPGQLHPFTVRRSAVLLDEIG